MSARSARTPDGLVTGHRGRLARLAAAVLVFLLPFAASLGPMVRIGPLAAARLVGALLVGLAVVVVARRRRIPMVALWALLVMAVWIGWGFARVSQAAGTKELLSVGVGMGSVVALVSLAGDRGGWQGDTAAGWFRTFGRGWLLGWFTTCLPAVWEIATGRHLWNYREDAALWIRLSAKDIASYMVNPNLFAFFLASAMGMLMLTRDLERGWLRWVYTGCIVLSPVICWPTNSRILQLLTLALLAWWLMGHAWFWRLARRAAWLVPLVVAGLAVRLATSPNPVPGPHVGSNYQRLGLYRNGWYMIWRTLGLGVGPGGFEDRIDSGWAPWDILGGPHNPHSGLFETASQYGLLVAALGLSLLLALLLLAWPVLTRTWPDPRQQSLRWNLLAFAALALPMSFANSTWLDSSVAFVQLAGLAMAANVLTANRQAARPGWLAGRATVGLPRRQRLLARAAPGEGTGTR